jgi:uncharacterized protein RhaS with RHS repeats
MPTTPRRRSSCWRCDRRFVARWLSRDPIAEEGGLNLYEFVYNNPLNYIDRFGLWSGAAHEAFMDHALGKILKPKYMKILKGANTGVDTIIPNENFKHSMRDKNESAAHAIQARDKWIKDKIDEAMKHAKKGDCEKALKALGEALHTVNDSESPVHVDESGNPKVYDTAKDHSPTDWIGKERTKDITKAIYDSQDKRVMDAFNQVFDTECPCRKKIDP